jgi:hypothetical protein
MILPKKRNEWVCSEPELSTRPAGQAEALIPRLGFGDVGQALAAAIRWEQCQLYGAIQQTSLGDDRAQLPDLLERQADLEAQFIVALG